MMGGGKATMKVLLRVAMGLRALTIGPKKLIEIKA